MKINHIIPMFFIISCCAKIHCYQNTQHEKRDWTILIYMAADNDLFYFSKRNIRQLLASGAHDNVHVVICYFYTDPNLDKKIVQHIYISNNMRNIIEESEDCCATNSGDEDNMTLFCNSTILQFPADHYALFFWDHGTGPIDPFEESNRSFTDTLTHFGTLHSTNKKSNVLQLHRGVCFDDTHNSCLTERKLAHSLSEICPLLAHKKFDIIGFDTCLMATIETASLIEPFAHYMVASQDLEPGAGWNYEKILSIFLQERPISPCEFACHIVEKFSETYKHELDCTLSAFDLSHTTHMNLLLKIIAEKLVILFKNQKTTFIQRSRDPAFCTHFYGSDYIDLIHFYKNILTELRNIKNPALEDEKQQLTLLLQQAIATTFNCIVHNKTGNNHTNAHGISIYFPAQSIHHSYKSNMFANLNYWLTFLHLYNEANL